MISVHTSNTMADCDNLFIPDYLALDKIVSKLAEKKQEDLEFLLENFLGTQ